MFLFFLVIVMFICLFIFFTTAKWKTPELVFVHLCGLSSNNFLFFVLNVCSLSCKVAFLFKVLEPLLHRDYIYHRYETQDNSVFKSLSTFITREKLSKLEKDLLKSRHVSLWLCKFLIFICLICFWFLMFLIHHKYFIYLFYNL